MRPTGAIATARACEGVVVSSASANFSARLDEQTDERFSELVRAAGAALGKMPSYRGRRAAERVDLLRAFLVLAEGDHVPGLRDAVFEQIRADRHARYGAEPDGARS